MEIVFAVVLSITGYNDNGYATFEGLTDPVEMTADECLKQSIEINLNEELPIMMFCFGKADEPEVGI